MEGFLHIDNFIMEKIIMFLHPDDIKNIKCVNQQFYNFIKNNTFFNELCNQKLSCKNAIKDGNVKLLKYLHKQGYKMNNKIGQLAASRGYVDCLKYAHENGCSIGDICEIAAANGQIAILKYAFTKDIIKTPGICEAAAYFGNLECLKYAHENGCYINILTMHNAVEKRQYECFKYGYNHNFPMDEYTKKAAINLGLI